MPNVDALDVVRVLVLIFSVVGGIGSISSMREQRRDIHPEYYSKLTIGQQITAARMMTREIERLFMFGFFIIAASSNLARGYVEHGGLKTATAMAVLFSLLAINFVLMVGTFRDRKKTEDLKEIIRKKKEAEAVDTKTQWLEAERMKDGNT